MINLYSHQKLIMYVYIIITVCNFKFNVLKIILPILYLNYMLFELRLSKWQGINIIINYIYVTRSENIYWNLEIV